MVNRSLLCVLLLVGSTRAAADLHPMHLRCEFTDNPMGVDVKTPRLSWWVESKTNDQKQTAYQILAASTAEALSRDSGDLWDTGRVNSDQTTLIHYQGKPLTSSQQVFWKVRVWDKDEVVSPWSDTATWTMGLLQASDWQGRWIVAPWTSEALLLRKDFTVKSPVKRALVFVCGLGQYELFLNGAKVGRDLLSPGWTQYNHTCLYNTRDITALLQSGANAVGLALGKGMYHTERRNRFSKFQGSFGPLRAIAQIQIEYTDGSRQIIGTDDTWRVNPGPITFDDIYGGEDFDARRVQAGWDRPGFDEHNWTPAVLLLRPKGNLCGLSCAAPPIRAIEARQPVSIHNLSERVQVVDLGQNTSYMPRIQVSGPTGSTIRLTHAEVLFPDGSIDRATCGGNRGPAYWQYTKATDQVETWFPQFFYAGCRYLQVDRIPAQPGGPLPTLDKIEGVVVHSVARPVGDFDCSNPLLGRIRTLVRWAQCSNMVSILTDCPHREKLGWLEQYHLNGPAIRYEFNVTRIFIKGMHDMADSQTDAGLIPNIAPEFVKFKGTFRAAAEWGAAFILVAWQHYLWTGDVDLLRQYYPAMKRYVAYLDSRSRQNLLDEGLGDWYDLGPKKPGHAQLTPPLVTASAFYFLDTQTLGHIAALLDRDQDAQHDRAKASDIRRAYRARFYHADPNDPLAGQFATGSQCSNALALVLGLAEPRERPSLLKALVQDIRKRGNAVTAGDIGFRYLLLALAQGGRSDVIYDMIDQDDKPGYGYMLKHGATSLTESWDANHRSSQNHFMLGQITEWFYRTLVGIDIDPDQPGFKNILIHPQPVGDLTWAAATYESIRGPISVRWDRHGTRFILKLTIPANTTATIHMPGQAQPIQIESGSYTFESKL